MRKRFYLFVMVDGVGPDLFGPYGTEEAQTAGLIAVVGGMLELGPSGSDTIHWLEINEQGVPSMGSYSEHYMGEIRKLAGCGMEGEEENEQQR